MPVSIDIQFDKAAANQNRHACQLSELSLRSRVFLSLSRAVGHSHSLTDCIKSNVKLFPELHKLSNAAQQEAKLVAIIHRNNFAAIFAAFAFCDVVVVVLNVTNEIS